jgi:hypothetical protein
MDHSLSLCGGDDCNTPLNESQADNSDYAKLLAANTSVDNSCNISDFNKSSSRILAFKNKAPAPKEGYQCSPSMEDLRKMTVKELENVEDFTVSNSFGSIFWPGKTDVTRVNLADIITII